MESHIQNEEGRSRQDNNNTETHKIYIGADPREHTLIVSMPMYGEQDIALDRDIEPEALIFPCNDVSMAMASLAALAHQNLQKLNI